MNITGLQIRAAIAEASDCPRVERGMLAVIRRHFHEDGIVERVARFQRFYAATKDLPWVWGQTDCSILVADWATANGFSDPAAHLRETYSTERGCGDVLQAGGGLLAVFGDCAARAGLTPLHEPQFGAVAVIGSATRLSRQWAAIWSGNRWLVRHSDKQLSAWVPFAAKPLAIWSVACPKL